MLSRMCLHSSLHSSSDSIADEFECYIYSGEASKRAKRSEGGLRTNWQKRVTNVGAPTYAHRNATAGPPLPQSSPTATTSGPVVAGISPFDNQPAGPAPLATAGSAKSARNARQVGVVVLCGLVSHSHPLEVRVAISQAPAEPEVKNAVSTSKRNKTWRLADLPVPNAPTQRAIFLLNWKRVFVTTIISWAGVQLNTFETNSTVIVMAETAWSLLFPSLGPLSQDGLDAVVGNVCSPILITF